MLLNYITDSKLMTEWNDKKNPNLNPKEITLGSHKKVWWKCEKGHEWEAAPNHRQRGEGCPYCLNKKVLIGYNDLATTDPSLVKEWNYEKNGNLRPENVVRGSAKKVWWKCEKGHEWETLIYARAKDKTGCPYCSNQKILAGYNDLKSSNPELVKEWNYEKNGNLSPSQVAPYTNKKVWWKCEKGHEWETAISDRQKGKGCPYCSSRKVLVNYNDLTTTNKELTKEWNYEKNGNLRPENVTNNSSKKVWWKCEKGHEWEATIYSRNYGNGCPYCSNESQTSLPEKILCYYVKKMFGEVIENYKPSWLKPMEIDIFIPSINVAVEYDGRRWHNDSKKDNKKNNICKLNNVILYRLREDGCAPINDDSINYTLTDIKADGSHVISGIIWLAKQLNKKIDVDIDRDFDEINNLINYYSKSISLTNEKLIREWNYEKNGNLRPENVTNNSSKKVWWKCEKGHEWRAGINGRQRGDSCPYCSNHKILAGYNDLTTTHPELIKEWNYEKNKNVDPKKYSKGSAKKVWWKCKKGHEYQTAISTRTSGVGCSICNGKKILVGYNDLKSSNPSLVKEWNYEKNGNLRPENVTNNSNKKVWWKCEKGHEWETTIACRSNGSNCPYCSNHKLLIGYNDLLTKYPLIGKNWNYEKNENLEPQNFLPSDKKNIINWKCFVCGYEFEKTIYNIVRSPRCPKCHKNLL